MTTPQAASVPHETYATRFSFRPVALGRRGMVATANILSPARDASGFAVATIPRRPRATGRKLNRVAYVSWGTEAAWGVVMT